MVDYIILNLSTQLKLKIMLQNSCNSLKSLCSVLLIKQLTLGLRLRTGKRTGSRELLLFKTLKQEYAINIFLPSNRKGSQKIRPTNDVTSSTVCSIKSDYFYFILRPEFNELLGIYAQTVPVTEDMQYTFTRMTAFILRQKQSTFIKCIVYSIQV